MLYGNHATGALHRGTSPRKPPSILSKSDLCGLLASSDVHVVASASLVTAEARSSHLSGLNLGNRKSSLNPHSTWESVQLSTSTTDQHTDQGFFALMIISFKFCIDVLLVNYMKSKYFCIFWGLWFWIREIREWVLRSSYSTRAILKALMLCRPLCLHQIPTTGTFEEDMSTVGPSMT